MEDFKCHFLEGNFERTLNSPHSLRQKCVLCIQGHCLLAWNYFSGLGLLLGELKDLTWPRGVMHELCLEQLDYPAACSLIKQNILPNFFVLCRWPCKQFGPRSGSTERRSWSGSKLFDILVMFLEEFFKTLILKKSADSNKSMKNYSACILLYC